MAKKLKDKHVGGFQFAMFVPESGWKLPTEFPDLSRAKYLGIDVESDDPNLQKQGPGFLRGDAKVVGISLATEDNFKIYLPFGHYSGQNLDKSRVIEYVKAQVNRPDQIKVGANLMYEQEALDSLGIEIKGPLWDIQVAEPILNEDKPDGHSLEQLSWDYLGYGKSEKDLRAAADALFLDPKKQMCMMPPEHVGKYAENDALNPVKIIQFQLERIKKENLEKVWKLECDLLPVLWKMRKKGLKVDLDYAERLSGEILAEENRLLQSIREHIDYKVDPWSGPSLFEMFRRLGLEHYVNYTAPSKNHPQGQPSFTNDFFKGMAGVHPVCAELAAYRGANKMRRDFVGGLILGKNINGRLHPQWHQLKKKGDDDDVDDAGAETGRITSSKPCLTQVPIRSEQWGKKIRRTFIADDGGRYCKNDYSQQEPRWTLHFAFIKGYAGAAEARQKYLDDPSTDYHDMTRDMILSFTGQDLPRRQAKDINLGAAYGMGMWKLARKLGVDVDRAKEILKTYHEGMPFVKKLGGRCMELVLAQGFIRTILGRKRRFNYWEPVDWDKRKSSHALRDYDEAVERWQEVQRADAHKAMNSMVQGSAADQTKQAIVLLDAEGLTPQIQVYDELGQTVYSDRDAWRIAEVMEHAIETTVPHLASPDVGLNWADVEELRR